MKHTEECLPTLDDLPAETRDLVMSAVRVVGSIQLQISQIDHQPKNIRFNQQKLNDLHERMYNLRIFTMHLLELSEIDAN